MLTIKEELDQARADLVTMTAERDTLKAQVDKLAGDHAATVKALSDKVTALEADKSALETGAKETADKLAASEKALADERAAHAALRGKAELNPAFIDVAGSPAAEAKVGTPGANDEALSDNAAIMAQYMAMKDDPAKLSEAHEFWKKHIEGKKFSAPAAKR